MKLGVCINWRGANIDFTRSVALEADRLRFEYLWLTEAWGLEALSTAGYLLGITKYVKIGAGVLNVYSRSAALVGMACATLDQIAPDRFILGLGSSGRTVVENWHGTSFVMPMQRTKEYVEIISRVSRGDNLDYSGKILRVSGFRLYTNSRSLDQEIYIGAIGDRNLTIAGQISDGAIVTMYPLSKISHALDRLGPANSTGKVKKLFAYVPLRIALNSEETVKARVDVAKNISFYVSSMGSYYAKNLARLGLEDSVKKILKAYSVGGSKAASDSVDDDLIDELSIIGDIEKIREKIRNLPQKVIPVFTVDPQNLRSSSSVRLNLLEPLLREQN
jgi:alkanesulfonate monooxygenase SsuD/methylene tetrahydromethanopterin reductase-like flavin-dependent oxidoreductase (luciferase family)